MTRLQKERTMKLKQNWAQCGYPELAISKAKKKEKEQLQKKKKNSEQKPRKEPRFVVAGKKISEGTTTTHRLLYNIRQALAQWGYPEWAINKVKKEKEQPQKKKKTRSENQEKNKALVVVPYIEGFTFKSAIAQHVAATNHVIEWEEENLIDQEQDETTRWLAKGRSDLDKEHGQEQHEQRRGDLQTQ